MNNPTVISEEISNMEIGMIALAASAAQLAYDSGEGVIPETAEEVVAGKSFTIPLLIPIGVESGDGRKLLTDSLTTRDLPISLLWQPQTDDGHKGSFIVARIDSCDITDKGIENAKGVFDTGPWGREAQRLVENKMLRGVSADLDKFEAVEDAEEMAALAEEGESVDNKLFIKKARVMAATLVPKPAFQECEIILDEDLDEGFHVVDGIFEAEVEEGEEQENAVSAMIASVIPVTPPKEWFDAPSLNTETPLTVDDNGRVYGHIATWSTDHISFGQASVRPPKSRSKYAYFHTGLVRTQEGDDVAVGNLTLAGGHADLSASAQDAVRHYDDTASAVADVHAGEDAFGIWVAGALRPGVSPEQVRILRASAPSGDWRPINGKLELVAVCQVNVPGFPVARACVASGVVMSLTAAGAGPLYNLKHPDFSDLEDRVAKIEMDYLIKQKEMALNKVKPIVADRNSALVAAAAELRQKFAPDLEARRIREQELSNAAESLRDRVSEFKVRPDWNPDLHPRDDEGKFRHVLLRLSDLLDGLDSGDAKATLERAAIAEESGDLVEADRIGQEALDGLEKMADDETNVDVKAMLRKAVSDVGQAISQDATSPAVPGESGFEEGLRAVVSTLLDELYEEVDPERIAGAAMNRLQSYVDGSNFESPAEVLKLLADMLKKQLQPNTTQ